LESATNNTWLRCAKNPFAQGSAAPAHLPGPTLVFAQQRNCPSSDPLKTIGLISDTHGLLRPEAVRALSGVQHIIHAGDIGGPEILEQLRAIAPLDAVRGNNDKGAWAAQIPLYLALELEGVSIHVLHDVKEIDVDPRAAGFDVVVSGHSHKPMVAERDGVQFVNPGSAGPRRFRLPVTIARLDVKMDEGLAKLATRIIEIL
jgi:putative phosphoesterase